MSTLTPTKNQLRRLIDEVLRTDADLEAFFIDHYPSVQLRFAAGMQRTDKVNLLLQLEPDIKNIVQCLSRRFPDAPIRREYFHYGGHYWAALGAVALATLVLLWVGMQRAFRVTPLPVPTPASALSRGRLSAQALPIVQGTNNDNVIVSSPGAVMLNAAHATGTGVRMNSGNRIEGSSGAKMNNEIRGVP